MSTLKFPPIKSRRVRRRLVFAILGGGGMVLAAFIVAFQFRAPVKTLPYGQFRKQLVRGDPGLLACHLETWPNDHHDLALPSDEGAQPSFADGPSSGVAGTGGRPLGWRCRGA